MGWSGRSGRSGGLRRSALNCMALTCVGAVAISCTTVAAQSPRELLDRAMKDFADGRITESVARFDQVATLDPASAPYLWQRGIALYYAGRFADCRDQFVSHRTVNPDDVENAAWHFLCVARAESPAAARASILPVGPDARVPMRQVYEMLRGTFTEAQVMAAAGSDPGAQFFANLYVGLYLEATGDRDGARKHITAAADQRFAQVGGYMHDVARVHAAEARKH